MPNRKRGIIFMNMSGIIKDSLRYPFSDWKKILFLGLIVVIYTISINIIPFNIHSGFTYQFLVISLLINFFILGYFFKIIQYSLKNTKKLPKFSNWVNLFKNGFKLTFVGLIYSIPATLPLILLTSSLLNFYLYQPTLFIFIMGAIEHIHPILWSFVYILYFLILFPISLIAIANMAKNDGKLSYAFKFKEIFDKIKNIGWIKFYSWYLLTSVINYLIFLIGLLIVIISILFHTYQIEKFIDALILTPYIYIFFSRSIALIYKSDQNNLN